MLKIHMLNVGHGDCLFIDHPSGRLSMIDINNTKRIPSSDQTALRQHFAANRFSNARMFKSASWEDYYRSLMVDPVDYYHANFDGRPIHRYIQTHPDMDHMTGLNTFFFDEKIELLNFWDTAHTKVRNKDDFERGSYEYVEWLAYQLLRLGHGPDDSTHKVLRLGRDDVGAQWSEDGISVLSPTDALVSACNNSEKWNDASYVIRIFYGKRAILLPGDATKLAWDDIVSAVDAAALKSSVLKAAHHGRESGFHQQAMEAVRPKLVLCSVGKKPETDASNEYAALGATVLSTRYHGTLVMTVWPDGEVWVADGGGARVAELPALS